MVLAYTGQSESDRQSSPLCRQRMVVGQSLFALQPSLSVPPREHVPPLPARGQSVSRWQATRLWVEQVPMSGQGPPGLVQGILPYLQAPTDAHGC